MRVSALGVRQVPESTIEAATTFGASRRQVSWGVRIPLALPAIMLAVNQVILMVVAMVVIAGLTGGGGLGYLIIDTFTRNEIGQGFEVAIALTLMAMVLDRLTRALAERFQPPAAAADPSSLTGQKNCSAGPGRAQSGQSDPPHRGLAATNRSVRKCHRRTGGADGGPGGRADRTAGLQDDDLVPMSAKSHMNWASRTAWRWQPPDLRVPSSASVWYGELSSRCKGIAWNPRCPMSVWYQRTISGRNALPFHAVDTSDLLYTWWVPGTSLEYWLPDTSHDRTMFSSLSIAHTRWPARSSTIRRPDPSSPERAGRRRRCWRRTTTGTPRVDRASGRRRRPRDERLFLWPDLEQQRGTATDDPVDVQVALDLHLLHGVEGRLVELPRHGAGEVSRRRQRALQAAHALAGLTMAQREHGHGAPFAGRLRITRQFGRRLVVDDVEIGQGLRRGRGTRRIGGGRGVRRRRGRPGRVPAASDCTSSDDAASVSEPRPDRAMTIRPIAVASTTMIAIRASRSRWDAGIRRLVRCGFL